MRLSSIAQLHLVFRTAKISKTPYPTKHFRRKTHQPTAFSSKYTPTPPIRHTLIHTYLIYFAYTHTRIDKYTT